MATTRTFSIIKPDATRRNLTGAVNTMIEAAGLRIVAQKRLQLSRDQAEGFYAVHRERGFFGELVAFMISGPVVVQVLEGNDAVPRYREIMGATNPPTPPTARSARSTPRASRRTPSTAPTATRMPRPKSPISLRQRKSSAKGAAFAKTASPTASAR